MTICLDFYEKKEKKKEKKVGIFPADLQKL